MYLQESNPRLLIKRHVLCHCATTTADSNMVISIFIVSYQKPAFPQRQRGTTVTHERVKNWPLEDLCFFKLKIEKLGRKRNRTKFRNSLTSFRIKFNCLVDPEKNVLDTIMLIF